MRILFVTPSIPSLLHRVRALNLLKALSGKHAVRLVSLAPAHDAVPDAGAINFLPEPPRLVPHPFTRSVIQCAGAPFRGAPLEIAYCASRAMAHAVREEIATFQPDVLYVKRLRSAQFVPRPLPCPALLDVTDAMAESYRRALTLAPLRLRPLFWHEARAYRSAERRAAAAFSHWVTASAEDAASLRASLPPATQLSVIPNVVDTATFAPPPERAETPRLLLSGLMDKVVNVSAATYFVRHVFPQVRAAIPDAKLTIAGPRPTRAARGLARTTGVTVTGYVPDLRPLIAAARVVVVPILAGTGTRNKILQAWAMARAVVSTPQGAEGLAARDGENCLLASTPAAFAASVVRCLRSPRLRQSLGAAGRRTVEERYDLQALARALENVLAVTGATRAIMEEPWPARQALPSASLPTAQRS